MKQVTRYKCDYCNRNFARQKKVEQHEKECCKNPNGVNCYLCVHVRYGDNGTPYCDEYEVTLSEMKHSNPSNHKSYAPNCSDFVRDEQSEMLVDTLSDMEGCSSFAAHFGELERLAHELLDICDAWRDIRT